MDGRRFDACVQAWAGRSSRRGVLRGAAALAAASALALVRAGAAGARHGRIPLGGACRHTVQCQNHAPTSRHARQTRNAVYCDDNGFRYDGALNCCHDRGGSCTRDEHCCGARYFCRNRVCTYLR